MISWMEWWLWNIELIEEFCFVELENQGVPKDQKPYYIRFAKRLENRALKFTERGAGTTFQLEKTSLLNEFVLRGLNLTVLEALQVIVEALVDFKMGIPLNPAWTYDNVIGVVWSQVYGAYDNRLGKIWIAPPQGSQGGYYDNRT